ncbi:unnamed protein product [Cuscuta epithymum]|uniref:Uncharacterized protein n=1 Tax=Cuscuta epithymum TaxID=186058 RepID=A0AAV0CMD4_9ASTE|nr:unnamed protein product [Cuscuta epithymum]
MLRWMCGHTRKERLKNEIIRQKVGVAHIEDKMQESRLRWFGHVGRRLSDAPVRRVERWGDEAGRRRGIPKESWIKGNITNIRVED